MTPKYLAPTNALLLGTSGKNRSLNEQKEGGEAESSSGLPWEAPVRAAEDDRENARRLLSIAFEESPPPLRPGRRTTKADKILHIISAVETLYAALPHPPVSDSEDDSTARRLALRAFCEKTQEIRQSSRSQSAILPTGLLAAICDRLGPLYKEEYPHDNHYHLSSGGIRLVQRYGESQTWTPLHTLLEVHRFGHGAPKDVPFLQMSFWQGLCRDWWSQHTTTSQMTAAVKTVIHTSDSCPPPIGNFLLSTIPLEDLMRWLASDPLHLVLAMELLLVLPVGGQARGVRMPIISALWASQPSGACEAIQAQCASLLTQRPRPNDHPAIHRRLVASEILSAGLARAGGDERPQELGASSTGFCHSERRGLASTALDLLITPIASPVSIESLAEDATQSFLDARSGDHRQQIQSAQEVLGESVRAVAATLDEAEWTRLLLGLHNQASQKTRSTKPDHATWSPESALVLLKSYLLREDVPSDAAIAVIRHTGRASLRTAIADNPRLLSRDDVRIALLERGRSVAIWKKVFVATTNPQEAVRIIDLCIQRHAIDDAGELLRVWTSDPLPLSREVLSILMSASASRQTRLAAIRHLRGSPPESRPLTPLPPPSHRNAVGR